MSFSDKLGNKSRAQTAIVFQIEYLKEKWDAPSDIQVHCAILKTHISYSKSGIM